MSVTRYDPVLTPHEAAEQLRLSYETLLAYLANGTLVGVKRDRRWFIRQSAVEEFLTPDVP